MKTRRKAQQSNKPVTQCEEPRKMESSSLTFCSASIDNQLSTFRRILVPTSLYSRTCGNCLPVVMTYLLQNHRYENLKSRITSSSSIGTSTLSCVSACSTVIEHSQQEGFTECCCQRHVKPLTWRRTGDLDRSNFHHKRPPASEATLANLVAEGGTMGEKWPRNFAECGDFHVTFGFFYIP
jgi:hypothetical protein